MKPVYEKHKDGGVVFLAVSIDTDKEKVPPLVEKEGYPYLVLLSDGTIEKALSLTSIPQLYILDGEGNVRFHEVGFGADHFAQHMDWMIEAAGKAFEGERGSR